jgi:nucleotide-binding universal stress UspA family protein
MLNKILVPLDGSELAERALTYATALAGATGANLLLVRAAFSHTLAGVDPRERQLGAVAEAEAYLQQLATKLRDRGFVCETVARYGHAPECITESARTRHADLIVMATHGRTGPGRWVLGSVAEAVVAASPIPALVQRAWQPLFGKPLLSDKPRVIVPLDGSAFAETALEAGASLAEDLGAKLILISVQEDPAGLQAARPYLPMVSARLAEKHPQLAIDTDVRVGDVAFGIEQMVAQHEARAASEKIRPKRGRCLR